MLKRIEIKDIRENDKPRFVKTQAVTYKREGEKEALWEMVKSHDSVHVLVNNTETKELLLVKQNRIPVLVNSDDDDGEVIEVCAGIVDKDLDLVEIAREEILEELGYDVPVDIIDGVRQFQSSVGTSGSTTSTFYAEVTEDMKVSEGGGLEGEDIEVVRIPYNLVKNFILSSEKTDATTLFLLTFFLSEDNR